MVADILSSAPGSVVAIASGSLPPLTLSLDGWGGSAAFRSLITGVAVRQSGNYQFLHTLRDVVYLYTFGNRMGDMAVTGLSHGAACSVPGDPAGALHGLEYVQQYYLDNCLAARASPVKLVLGRATAFSGFLTGLELSANDPERGLARFALRLAAVPEKVFLD